MRGWITASAAAARSGQSLRSITWRCNHQWAKAGRARKMGRAWKLDPTVDPAFMQLKPAADQAIGDLREYSKAKRDSAAIRRQILTDCAAYVARRMAGGIKRVTAINEFVTAYAGRYHIKFTQVTLYRWQRQLREAPATGLIDHRGITRGDQRDEPPPEARAEFERRYLDLRKPPLTTVHAELKLLAREHGWWWFGSLGSLRRWVANSYTKAQLVLNRQGKDVYRRLCEPYLQQDPEAFEPGQCYIGDHHQFREWCTHNGKLIRPWITAWQDRRSAIFAGWVIVPSPNQSTILAAARDAIMRSDGHLPAEWLVDNGKDYRGYALAGRAHALRRNVLAKGYLDETEVAGLFALLGSEVHFALPHNPQAKPVERSFKTLEEQFGRRLPTYTGRDPDDRPDDLQEILAAPGMVPSFEELARQWGDYIEKVYNAAAHPLDGRPRIDIFEQRPVRRQLADPRVLDLLMCLWSKPVKVSRNGVRFNKLLYGQWSPELLALQGQDVLVSYDPNDIASVGIWSTDYRWICRATQNELHGRGGKVTDEHMREGLRARRRIRKALKVSNSDRYAAYASTPELTIAAQAAEHHQRQADSDAASATGTDDALPKTVQIVRTPLDGQTDRAGRFQPSADAPVVRSGGRRVDLSNLGQAVIRSTQPSTKLTPPPVHRGGLNKKLRKAAQSNYEQERAKPA